MPGIILGAYNIREEKLVKGLQVATGKQTLPFWGNMQILRPDLCSHPVNPRALKETSKSFLPINMTLLGHGETHKCQAIGLAERRS